MNKVQINNLDDVSISGFDITVKLPNGEIQKIPNGVSSLLKGELSISTPDGAPILNSDILNKVNLESTSSVLIPGLINSESKEKQNEEQSKASEEKIINDQKIDKLQEKLDELKELRKKIEQEKKEKNQEEQEEKEKAEQDAQAKESGMVEEILEQLGDPTEKASAVAQEESAVVEDENAKNDNTSKKRADNDAPASSGSSSSSGAPVPPEEEEKKESESESDSDSETETEEITDLFIEVALSSRSDSGDKGDFITNSKTPTFEGKSLPGANVSLIIDGVTYQSVADSNGNFIISVPNELSDGEYSLSFLAKDDAGNEVSIIQQLVIDTVAPKISFDLTDEAGDVNTENITNINPPTFKGSVSGNPSKLYFTVGDKIFDLPLKNGDFSFTLPEELDDGIYEIVLTAVDDAGNESTKKEKITLDTVNDFGVSLSSSSDTGTEGDWLTNKEDITFRFDHEIGAKIQIIYNDKVYDVPVAETSPSLFHFEMPFTEGAHKIEFISFDKAGNRAHIEKTLQIDFTPPTFSYSGLTDETNSSDTSDNITSVKQPSFEGRAEIGSTIYLEIDGVTYNSVVGSDGHWSVPVSNDLRDGDYVLSVYAKDGAGNMSPVSTGQLTIDTKGPILEGGLDASSDTGSSDKDALTNADDLIFSGKTDPNIKVSLSIPDLGITQDVYSDANGVFSFPVFNIPEGTFSYNITAIDLAGNESPNALNGNVVVDRHLDDFTARLSAESDSGEDNSDQLTANTQLTFNGTGEVGATIFITVIAPNGGAGVQHGPVTVNSEGQWSYSVPERFLIDGNYTVRFDVSDIAGNSKKVDLPITVDTTSELTAQFDRQSDSGEKDNLTNVDKPSFSGTAEPGSVIKVMLTHAQTGTRVDVETVALRDGSWSLSIPKDQALTDQGDWSWGITATDLAGNVSAPVNGEFVFDNIPPTADVSLVSQTGFDKTHTHDPSLDFAIRTEPNTKVSVSIYKVEHGIVGSTPAYQSETPQIIPSNGQLVYSATGLPDGEYVYQFTLTDMAGNTSRTAELPVVIDTVPPTLGTVTLTSDSDSGTKEDWITNSKELTFRGKGADIGSHINVSVENTLTGEIITLSPSSFEVTNTSWVYTMPHEFSDGHYAISFIAEDSAGNFSTPIKTEINIDSAPPPIGDVGLQAGSDSGAHDDDFITKNTDPVFIGSSEVGALITISLYRGDTLITTASSKVENEDGSWKVPVMGLTEGNYHWVVTATDAAGNEATLNSSDQNIIIDQSYQGATAKLDDATNSGSLTDNLTQEQSVKLSGSGEIGSSVSIKSLVAPDGTLIDLSSALPTKISADGSWQLSIPTLSFGDGLYQWSVELTDLAGNTTVKSGSIQLDTETNISGTLESDTGVSDTDGITRDSTPTFSGKGEVNGTVKIVITDPNGNPVENILTGVVSSDGSWRITAPELSMDGTYTWRAEITDLAGNRDTTADQSFVLDTTFPVVHNASFEKLGGFETDPPEVNGENLSFSGQTSEGLATVSVNFYAVTNGVASGVPLFSSASFQADKFGFFSMNFATDIPDGEYQWSIEAFDIAGNSSESPPQAIIFDTMPPLISDVSLSSESDTSLIPGSNYTNDETPTFVGKSEEGIRISIEITRADGQKVNLEPAYVTTNADGTWSFTTSTVITDGEYSYVVKAMDPAGNVTQSETLSFQVDSGEPTVSFDGLSTETDSGANTTDMLTNAERPSFTGTVSENARVTVVLTSTTGGKDYSFSTEATSNGTWALAANENILEGGYTVTVTATDLAGNISDAVVSDLDLVIDRTVEGGDDFGLSANTDSGTSTSDDLTNVQNVKLTGQVEAGTTVTLASLTRPDGTSVDIDGALTVTANSDGSWTLNVPVFGEQNGTYSYALDYVDLAGNKKTVKGEFTFDNKIELNAEFDSQTGADNGAVYSNNDKPSISGTGTAGDKITVVVSGPSGEQILTAIVASDGHWSVDVAELTQDGLYSWVARSTDAAGNMSPSVSNSFTLDTEKPLLGEVGLEAASDTGLIKDDGVTQDKTPTFTLSGEAGVNVVIKIWAGVSATGVPLWNSQNVLIPESGRIDITLPTQNELGDGQYTWSATLTDIAGNVTVSTSQSLEVDTKAPSLDSFDLVSDSGSDSNDWITNDNTPLFQGVAEPGARVTMLVTDANGVAQSIVPANVTVGADGKWNYQLTELLKDGVYSVKFLVQDLAGNSIESSVKEIIIDTAIPSVTFDGLSGSSDTGANQSDMLTNVQRPTFIGTVSENATITVVLTSVSGGKNYIFTTAAASNGAWSLAANENILEGGYTVSVTATDVAGNQSVPVISDIDLVIDRAVEGGDEFGLSTDSDSGTSTSDDLTNVQNVKLTGEVEPGTTITLASLARPDGSFVNIDSALTVTADSEGLWTLNVPVFGEQNGTYSYALDYVDEAGNKKTVNGEFTFDNTIELTAQFDSQTGADDGVTYSNNDTPSISGTGALGDIVSVVVSGPAGEQTLTATVGSDGNWSVNVAELTEDGLYSWVARSTDAAGNISPPVSNSFTLDTEKPLLREVGLDAASDTGLAQDDGITQDKTPTFAVSGEAGVNVVIKVWAGVSATGTPLWNSQSVVIPQSGTVNITLPSQNELGDGQYTWTVTLTDIAGNVSISEQQALKVDTTDPTLASFDLVSDTGSNTNDWITNDNTPLFHGVAEIGARISLIVTDANGVAQSIVPAYVTVGADGKWNYQLTELLKDGGYLVKVLVQDLAGNSIESSAKDIVIDTATPSVTFDGLAASSDSGSNQADMLTSAERPVFMGTVSENAVITVVLTSVSGGKNYTFTTAAASNGAWELAANENILEGGYTVSVMATDIAGNQSPPVISDINLVIDRTVEGGDEFGLTADTDSGSSTSDDLTHQQNVKLSGEVEAGTTITLASLTRPDGTSVNIDEALTVTANSEGVWTLNVPVFGEQNGVYNYTLDYVDVAGNKKTVNGEFTFDNKIELSAEFDSQTGADDGAIYSNNDTPSISGTGTLGDIVSVVVSGPAGEQTLSVTVGSDGKWSVNAAELSKDGLYTWVATSTDAAGNISPSVTNTFILDTQLPLLGEVGLDASSDTGLENDDGITQDKTPTFSVSGEVGVNVVIKVWGGVSATGTPIWNSQNVQIPQSGAINITLPTQNELGDGQYTWTVTLTDIAGNESISAPQSLKVDTTDPTLGTFDLVSDSGSSTNDWITNDNTPLFEGVAEIGARVSLVVTDPNGVGQSIVPAFVTVGGNGKWSYQLTELLKDGDYSVKFIVEDAAGNKIESLPKDIVIDTVKPILSEVKITAESDTGQSDTDNITKDRSPVFEGKSEVGTVITLVIMQGSTLLHTLTTTVTDPNGSWSISNVPALPDDSYSWRVSAKDVAGNESLPSEGKITIDNTIEDDSVRLSAEDDKGYGTGDGITNLKDVSLTGTAEDNATVTLTSLMLNGVAIDISSISAITVNNGQWQLSLPTLNLGDGVYSYSVQVVDVAGNIKDLPGSITLDTQKSALTVDLKTEGVEDASGEIITNNNLPILEGTVSENSILVLEIYQGSEFIMQYGPTAPISGYWNMDVTNKLLDGTYNFLMRATDIAGNETQIVKEITIDTLPPSLTASLDSSLDSGALDNDGITQNKDLVIKGTVGGEGTSMVTLRFEFGLKGEKPQIIEKSVASGSEYNFNVNAAVDGLYDWKIIAIDVAGNASKPIGGEITVDSHIDEFSQDTGLDVDSDTGSSNTDNISSDTTPSFKGKTEPGAKVILTITLNGAEVVSVEGNADAKGKFILSVPASAALTVDGEYSWKLEAVDAAGNTSNKTGEYTLDTTAQEINFDLIGDTGNDADWVTKTKQLSIIGTTNDKAPIVVTLLSGTTVLNSETITPSGTEWSYSYPTDLEDGEYTITVESVDAAGNSFSSEKTLIIDTKISNSFELTSDSGTSINDQLTNANYLSFSGKTDKDASVSLAIKDANGTLIHTFAPTVDKLNGQWDFTLPVKLDDGNYTFVVTAEDVAGNINSTNDYEVTIDRKPPPVAGLQLDAADDTGEKGDWNTGNQTVRIHGQSLPGVDIIVMVSGIDEIITVTVEANGSFTIDLPRLEFGDYELTIMATDAAGNTTTKEQKLTISPDTIEFTVGLDEKSDTGFQGDNMTNLNQPTLVGRATPGYLIEAELNGHLYTAVTNERGEWSIDLNAEMYPGGNYEINFVIKDVAGNEVETVKYPLVIDRIADFSCELVDNSGDTSDNVINVVRPFFQGTGESGASVVLMFEGMQYKTQVTEYGTWMFQFPRDVLDGSHSISLYSVDLAGNKSAEHIIDFVTDTTIPTFNYEVEGLHENNGNKYINSSQEGVVFKGTASEAGKIIIQINNQEYTQTLTAGGNWTIDLGEILEKDHKYTIMFEDVAGNKVTKGGEFIVDKTINTFITMLDQYNTSPPDLYGGKVDHMTSSQTLGFGFSRGSSKIDPDVSASVSVTGPDGFQYSDTNINTAGTWTMPIKADVDGIYMFTWTFTDLAGNVAVTKMPITVDTYIDPISMEEVLFDGLPLVGDGIQATNEKFITVDIKPGVDNAYAEVRISVNGRTFRASEIGDKWSYVGVPLKEGKNTVTITAWDIAGNRTEFNHTVIVKEKMGEVDFSINGLDIADLSHVSDIISDSATGSVSLAGRADDGTAVNILVDGEKIDTVRVGADGSWVYDLSLKEGSSKIVIHLEDIAGNTEIINFNVTIDTQDPIVTIETMEGEGYLEVGNELHIKGETLTLSGKIDAGSAVDSVILNGVAIDLTGQDLSNKTWTVEISGLQEGMNSIVIVSKDLAGNEFIENVEIFRDSVVSDLTGFLQNSVVSDLTGFLQNVDELGTIDATPSFIGTVEIGSSVILTLTNTSTAEITTLTPEVSAEGNWSVTAPSLVDGTYSWAVNAVDPAGNSATISSNADFTLQTPVPEAEPNPEPDIPPTTFMSEDDTQALPPLLETKVFSGESEPETTVSLSIDNKTYETQSDDDGDWMIKVEFNESNTYDYQIEYQQNGGEAVVESGTTTINAIEIDTQGASSKVESDTQERASSSESSLSTYSNQASIDNYDVNFEHDGY